MKSNRVLIGLIVAAFVGGFNLLSAQTKANYQNNLIEIGPDNIGGRTRSLIVDQTDPSHKTIYAGGVAGGLFKKTGDDPWQYVPFFLNGRELTLPISAMAQLSDGQIVIATGEGIIPHHGVTSDKMSPKGRGLFLFNPSDNSFALFDKTNPATDNKWNFINDIAFLERDNFIYLYVATSNGLYRWKLNAGNIDLSANPSLVQAGNFYDVITISADNIAYASGPGMLYRIGNITAESAAINVTSSNPVFATASRIKLAAATDHKRQDNGSVLHTTFLYALVSNADGLMDALYLTKDQQSWHTLTTASVAPFTTKCTGTLSSAICIDPVNYSHVLIGGATVWSGEGFVENSNYQWTKSSYSEQEMNVGNYMSTVYNNAMVVHSGIHQIVACTEIEDGDTTWVFYLATDGGVYRSYGEYFTNINKGFNTVQYNSVAVSPDGSIIGGAINNSCPFIQSRNAHNGGIPTNQWYDNDSASNMNHIANVLWTGSGAGVASSIFQKVLPLTYRGIFTSCEPGHFTYVAGSAGTSNTASFARAFSDYADYNNTQTWSIAEAFLSNMVASSNPIPQMKLWETVNNTSFNDSISFTLDTLGTYYHNNEATPLRGNTVIEAGDYVLVPSQAHFDYPFRYTFTESFKVNSIDTVKTVKTIDTTLVIAGVSVDTTLRDTVVTLKQHMTHKVHNPIANRMIVNGRNAVGQGMVAITFSPTNFHKVWDPNEASSTDISTLNKMMQWSKLYLADEGFSVGSIAWSLDGDAAFINVINDTTGESFIMRVYNITAANANDLLYAKDQLEFVKVDYEGMRRVTRFDTIYGVDGLPFKRPVNSFFVDPRQGHDDLYITFGGYDTLNQPNLVRVSNTANKSSRTVTDCSVVNSALGMSKADPIYSGIVEFTTGSLYIGTDNGVLTTPENGNSWTEFGAFNGVPVTSICQQTSNLERQSYETHDGVNTETYLFARTKYPYAIYFGTYGRGVFMDSTYVTNHENEIVDSSDFAGITNVDKGNNRISVYPNPASDHASIDISVAEAGNAMLKVYDINGRLVLSQPLGYLIEGTHQKSINCSNLKRGMYLVNITFGDNAATSKLIVK